MKPNDLSVKCVCGETQTLGLFRKSVQCKCGVHLIYKPNVGRPPSRKWQDKFIAKMNAQPKPMTDPDKAPRRVSDVER